MRNLILLRGLPGSGKSTFAKYLMFNHAWFEADMWFAVYNNNTFDSSRLKIAHQWCKDQTDESLKNGYNVIVSNTFTQEWEMQDYFEIAKKYNAKVTVLVVENWHGNKSVHNVPEETMQKMRNRFEIKL